MAVAVLRPGQAEAADDRRRRQAAERQARRYRRLKEGRDVYRVALHREDLATALIAGGWLRAADSARKSAVEEAIEHLLDGEVKRILTRESMIGADDAIIAGESEDEDVEPGGGDERRD